MLKKQSDRATQDLIIKETSCDKKTDVGSDYRAGGLKAFGYAMLIFVFLYAALFGVLFCFGGVNFNELKVPVLALVWTVLPASLGVLVGVAADDPLDM